MFFISSIIFFSFLLLGSEKFSPNCNKQWTSCGIAIGVKFISQLSFMEVKEFPGILFLKNIGSISISIPPFRVECGEEVGWLSLFRLLLSFLFLFCICVL